MRSLLPVADLCLRLGEVERATMHADGRRETDTTHTVMLAVIACAVAAQHPELGLDLGLVAQLAVAHDLVEADAGDTDTFLITGSGQEGDKAAREMAALDRITKACADYPWIAGTITLYELQKCPEARFVRYMDKVCPRLTNTICRGAAVRARGHGREAMKARDDFLLAELAAQYPEFQEVCGTLIRMAADEAEAAFEDEYAADPTIPDSQFDTDHLGCEPYPALRQGEDGSLTLTYSGGELVSLDQGNTWRAVWRADLDCGCPDDGSGLWIQPPMDVDPGPGGDWCKTDCDNSTPVEDIEATTVAQWDARANRVRWAADGWRSTSTDSTPWWRYPGSATWTEGKPPASEVGPFEVRVVDTGHRTIMRGLQTGAAIRFDDTPGPDGKGAQSGIMLTLPAEGWPPGWMQRASWSTDWLSPCGRHRLLNIERDRRAAWVLSRQPITAADLKFEGEL